MGMAKTFANTGSKVAIIALVATLVVTALVWFAGTDTGARTFLKFGMQDGAAQTINAAERALHRTSDTLKSFIGRSPGARGATDVLKGKAERNGPLNEKVRVARKSEQRALGKVFDKPTESFTDIASPRPVLAFLPEEADAMSALTPRLISPAQPAGSNIFAPIIGGFGGGSVNGGASGIGGISGPPSLPPVASSVPEPSTWALLFLGFGAMGASLRRRANAGSFPTPKRAGHCAKN